MHTPVHPVTTAAVLRDTTKHTPCILLLCQSFQFLNTQACDIFLQVLLQLLSHTRSDFIANSCANIINCPGENNGTVVTTNQELHGNSVQEH